MQAPRYEPYLDVPPAPFRWRLGLRPLDVDDWLQVDQYYDHEIEEKHRVLDEHPGTVFRVLDGVEAESREALDAIVAHLRVLDSGRFGTLEPDPDLHPLDAAGRIVQEDLVLMVERDDGLVCGGGSVCFPNRWDLGSKIGLPMAAIHAPVAQLNETLADPIDRFLERLDVGRGYWRLGWGIVDTHELYQPVDGTEAPRPRSSAPEAHHLRVERETLRRFPETRCILFTIRTYITPLIALAGRADAATLAAAINAMPPDVADYKELDEAGSYLINWLCSLATMTTQ